MIVEDIMARRRTPSLVAQALEFSSQTPHYRKKCSINQALFQLVATPDRFNCYLGPTSPILPRRCPMLMIIFAAVWSRHLQHLAVDRDGAVLFRAGRPPFPLALEIRSRIKVMYLQDACKGNNIAYIILNKLDHTKSRD